MATSRGWREFPGEVVEEEILRRAGNSDTSQAQAESDRVRKIFEDKQQDVISLLHTVNSGPSDGFLGKLLKRAEQLRALSPIEFLASIRPPGQLSRDAIAVSQGLETPPHFLILAEVHAIREPAAACEALATITRSALAHLERVEMIQSTTGSAGTRVFIGHGRSRQWLELKEFIRDRLALQWDEFNRVPVAGIPNSVRLSAMLDSAAIAFLVLTAEDEGADGRLQARMNVVHEAGLFQGRLGFSRAIIMLEQGCEEFSNIEGLGQIRFPTGSIKAAFHEVQLVLEREKLIKPPNS